MAARSRRSGDRVSYESISTGSDRSDSDRMSVKTYSTLPTDCSARPNLSKHATYFGRIENRGEPRRPAQEDDASISTETYASTSESGDDFSDDDVSEDSCDEFDLAEFSDEIYYTDAVPSSPRDFADLFPSRRRLSIKHDDATEDGNMNLRVDTEAATRRGTKRPTTLFHLRMLDLKNRDFSLRRYGRDSGREVCHSARKFQTLASARRPALQKTISNAFASLWTPRPRSTRPSSKRQSIGHLLSPDQQDSDMYSQSERPSKKVSELPSNTISLEFANYAHVEVTRRGAGPHKRYEFEYWGVNYSWRRHVSREGSFENVSFHLVREGKSSALAHIVPVALTTTEAKEEAVKGGWIPPSSMYISDDEIVTNQVDLAE